ncbi:MAG TPA: ROK family transcriptional regulator [Friedmanniella sp.]
MAENVLTVPLDAPRLVPSADGSGALLALLRDRGAGTISELAAAMGLARSTVLQRMEHLRELGLVSSEPGTNSARGRPAAVSRFDPSAAVVLAAQVGMTGTRLAATDLSGEILHERFITVDVPAGPDRMLDDLLGAFDELLAALGPDDLVAGIGLGLPSSVELLTYARSLGSPEISWDRAGFSRALRERYQAPVFLDLDVNLLAMAERRRSWPGTETFVCVKLGTLINASIVVNGRPIHGISDRAGELGHLKVSGSTVPCTCGSTGCLDAVASGYALVKQLSAAGFSVTHVSDVVRLASLGQPEAVLAVREAGRCIGSVLASVVNLLNPAVIITWGYLNDAEAPIFAGIREGLYQAALPGSSERLELRRTTLGVLAGVRGAAAMVIDEVLAPAAVDRLVGGGSWARAWPATEAG